MGYCGQCIDTVPEAYERMYNNRQAQLAPAGGHPGATLTDNKWLWAIGGFAVGCIATVIFVNISGETSFRGLAGKTSEYAKKGYSTLDKAWGK
ncbi:MAG: hypothetical protein M0R06_15585 [Sphaerochaeta sp.]|nr:hypothetical protein [Sphaerochaeta sp.]